MLDDEQMAFLGLRGLIGQALREGDQAQALAYAERAFQLRPQTPWVVHSLFDMQAQIGQWKAAQETLDTGLRRRVVTQDKGRTLKALLLVERSRAAERDGQPAADALSLAREAFGLAPERIAVTSRLAELQIKAGDGKRAARTLERGWALAPHPDLAELYLKASGETEPLKRVGVMRRLAAQKPDDIESHLALAQASLDAGLWGEARRYLETRRRRPSDGPRLPHDGRGRGTARIPTRPRCMNGWRARRMRRPIAPGVARSAARIMRAGARCARVAARSAPCTGARPAPSARSCRPRCGRSWSSRETQRSRRQAKTGKKHVRDDPGGQPAQALVARHAQRAVGALDA